MKKLFLTTLLLVSVSSGFAQSKVYQNTISGTGDQLHDGDSVFVSVSKHGLAHEDTYFNAKYKTVVKDHRYTIRWESSARMQKIFLHFEPRGNNVFTNFDLLPGTTLKINYAKDEISFEEQPYPTVSVQYAIWKAILDFSKTHNYRFSYTVAALRNRVLHEDSLAKAALDALNGCSQTIPAEFRNYLNNNIRLNVIANRYADFNRHSLLRGGKFATDLYEPFQQLTRELPPYQLAPTTWDDPNQSYRYYINKLITEEYRWKMQQFTFKSAIEFIRDHFSGDLRENLIVNFARDSASYSQANGALMRDILPLIKTKDYQDFIKAYIDRTSGQKARDFAFSDAAGKRYGLSDFSGKVLVLDFWYTGCGNCRALQPYMAKIEDLFRDKSVAFVGVSADKDKSKWLKSVKEGQYVSSSILNLFSSGNGFLDPSIQAYKISGYPSLIIIDKHQLIHAVEVDPRIDGGKNLVSILKSLL